MRVEEPHRGRQEWEKAAELIGTARYGQLLLGLGASHWERFAAGLLAKLV